MVGFDDIRIYLIVRFIGHTTGMKHLRKGSSVLRVRFSAGLPSILMYEYKVVQI